MLIKAGVDISRLNREIRRALPKIQKVLDFYNEELIITSTFEGTHGDGSLHYGNDAVDMRMTRVESNFIKGAISQELGPDFDVVLEGDHIHVEYDPKR